MIGIAALVSERRCVSATGDFIASVLEAAECARLLGASAELVVKVCSPDKSGSVADTVGSSFVAVAVCSFSGSGYRDGKSTPSLTF